MPRCQTVFHRRDQTEHAQIDRKDTATAREVGTNSHGKTLTSPRTLLNTSQNKTNRGIHACRTCAYACIYTRNRTLVSGDDFEYHSPKGRLRENNIYNGENLSGFDEVVGKKAGIPILLSLAFHAQHTLLSSLLFSLSKVATGLSILYSTFFLSFLLCLTLSVFLRVSSVSSKLSLSIEDKEQERTERVTITRQHTLVENE